MVPVEGDRSIVTLAGFHGDVPPTDPDRYGDFARSLPSPLLADALAGTDEATAVMTHRMPTSQRRHVERLRRTPPGFLVLGDAICSFNPVYGQGMSSAALQAQALSRTIERLGPTSPSLAPAFYQQAAKAVDVPWKMAAGADFADSEQTRVGTGAANSKTRSDKARTRCAIFCSMAVATAGWARSISLKQTGSMAAIDEVVMAVTLAERGPLSIAEISPKTLPASMSRKATSLPSRDMMLARTQPSSTK
jgi:hypothetical protein